MLQRNKEKGFQLFYGFVLKQFLEEKLRIIRTLTVLFLFTLFDL